MSLGLPPSNLQFLYLSNHQHQSTADANGTLSINDNVVDLKGGLLRDRDYFWSHPLEEPDIQVAMYQNDASQGFRISAEVW